MSSPPSPAVPSCVLVLATRRSALALAQSRAFGAALEQRWPALRVEELQVVTTGDRITDVPLADLGGKGLFIKEIEQALIERRADFAVHSLKDVPAVLAPAFRLACFPLRADPRDVLVGSKDRTEHVTLESLATGARVGTSSLRRAVQIHQTRPDLEVVAVRGNVDTRLRKVDAGEVDAIVLAHAGLLRLGLGHRVSQILSPEVLIPAPGQGALAIECRADDRNTEDRLTPLTDTDTAIAVTIERGVMAAVGADCKLPFGAHARRVGPNVVVAAFHADPDGSRSASVTRTTKWPTSIDEALGLGADLGSELRDRRQLNERA